MTNINDVLHEYKVCGNESVCDNHMRQFKNNRCSWCGWYDPNDQSYRNWIGPGRQSVLDMIWAMVDVASKSATCPRASVGAVLVRDKHVLATGFNGSPPGDPHCLDVGCLIIDGHCKRTVHAEANAIAQAALDGRSTRDSIMYSTYRPCRDCMMLMASVGIKLFYYQREYNSHAPNAELPASIMAGYTSGISAVTTVQAVRADIIETQRLQSRAAYDDAADAPA